MCYWIEDSVVQKITLRARVGSDGVLHLDLPVGVHDADLEVTVIMQPVTPQKAKSLLELGYPPDFFERTGGSLQDEPLVRYPQGELQERNWDDLFA